VRRIGMLIAVAESEKSSGAGLDGGTQPQY
jgi:hypothetical protein